MLTKPLDHIRNKAENIIPSMRWDGNENFFTWQEKGRKKLFELMGLPFKKCEDKFQIECQLSYDTFNETRFTFQSEEGFFIPCHFWVPKNVSGPLPLVICLQGHNKGMHISMGRQKYSGDEKSIGEGDRDFAVRAIKEGYCVLIMEQRCFGELGSKENGDPDCTVSCMASILMGSTITSARVWDLQRALDLTINNFPEVDKNKIICMGNSGGGLTTLYAACLDMRISHAMPSGYLCSFTDLLFYVHTCVCNFIPNIRLFFDMGDLAGLIAPRPLVIVAGITDLIIPFPGVLKAHKEAQRLYAGAGAADKIKLAVGEGGHRFYADIGWNAMNSFIQ